MMNRLRATAICCGLVIASALATSHSTQSKTTFHSTQSIQFSPTVFTSSAGESVPAEMGWLTVPERRSQSDNKTIRLPVVRFKATGTNPGYPIVYLAGGPGASGLASAKAAIFPVVLALRERADVIVFDQRGTGLAEPSLVVPGNLDLPLGVSLDHPDSRRQLLDKTKAATAEIKARGIDLSSYNTVENAADVNDLRLALGAEKLTLWGHSYGSHLGLTVIRHYGQFIDKAILSGINGPDQRWRYPSDLESLIDRVDDQIENIPKLHRQMPSLKKTVESVLKHLADKPVVVQLKNQPSGIAIGRKDVEVLTALQAGDWEFIKNLPQFYGRMAEGDFTGVAQIVQAGLKTREIGTAMRYSMHIASGVSVDRAALIEKQQQLALFGNAINFPFDDKELRDAWAVDDLGADFRAPIKSDVPALFLSGTLDGRTSVADADEIRRGFSNNKQVIVEGGSHDFYHLTPKVRDAMLSFLSGGPVPSRISLAVEFRGPDERKLMLELRKLIMTKGIEAGVKRMREMNAPKSDTYLTTYVIGVLGTTLLRDDKLPNESLEVFKAGVELFPDNAFLNERLADAYLAADKKEMALSLYQKCLELNSLNRTAYLKVKQLGGS
jgi:pimeloyl-ACP methyl ester carboxylesterase